MPDGMLDAYVIVLGREVPKNYNPHEGEELIFALEGRSEFTYDGQVFILEPGDCVYYDAKIAHNIRAHTLPAKVLSVLMRHRL
jgi:quercetin dioxygenase-like cupin family protein